MDVFAALLEEDDGDCPDEGAGEGESLAKMRNGRGQFVRILFCQNEMDL
jgi:hypothetical protein